MGNVDACCRCERCNQADDIKLDPPSGHVDQVPVLEPVNTQDGPQGFSSVGGLSRVGKAPRPQEDDRNSNTDAASTASAKQPPKPKKASRKQSNEKQEEDRMRTQEQKNSKAADEEAAMALARKKAQEEEEQQVNRERLRRLGPLGRDGAKLQVQLETGWADCTPMEMKQVYDHVGGGDTKFPIQARGAMYLIDWTNPAAITQTNMTSQKKRNMRVV